MNNSFILKKPAISIQQKLDILHKLNSGVSVVKVACEYCLHPTTVRRIRRNGLTVHGPGGESDQIQKKKLRESIEELEIYLHAWLVERKALGKPITDPLLQEQARHVAGQFVEGNEFEASNEWLAKFKNRYYIHVDETQDEKGTVVDEFAASFARKIVGGDIQCDDLYNMAETGLMWKAIPTEMLGYNNEINIEGEQLKKDRVTIGLCANATGTHKLRPLLIHKFDDLSALHNAENPLAVLFKTQKSIYINQSIFKDWYENHFKPVVRKRQSESGTSRTVVLLLDSCWWYKIDPSEQLDDDYFKILFLPPNTTSILQPINQGVVAKTKMSFRHKLLQQVLSYPGGIQEFYQKYSIEDCIKFLYEAWTDTSAISIFNAWRGIVRCVPWVKPVTEETTDPLEPQLEDVIGAILSEELSNERIREFLSNCEEAENNFSEEETEEVNEEEEGQEVHEPKVGENIDIKEEFYVEQRVNAMEEGLEDLQEDARRKELRAAFNVLTKYAEKEAWFVQVTIANLQKHFLDRTNNV
ncbi:jerky protein homolog-like [Colletes gigas]|uniref:jerky protein homolog-like n=1 Tax=Colletes gigas TaxID=935657 RepID=UPI001C9AD77A|nr:jerky protein homolog-like [Colletes gigas]